jgi:hypothetical protein
MNTLLSIENKRKSTPKYLNAKKVTKKSLTYKLRWALSILKPSMTPYQLTLALTCSPLLAISVLLPRAGTLVITLNQVNKYLPGQRNHLLKTESLQASLKIKMIAII